MNYYRRYPGDYARDTGHLSLAEHGAYTLLMDHYYSVEQALPGPLEALYRLCRAMTPEEQSAVSVVANAFFPVGRDGRRHNRRCDAEISQTETRRKTGTVSGRKGGRQQSETQDLAFGNANGNADRKGGRQQSETQDLAFGNANGNADCAQDETPGKALQTPDSNVQTPDSKGEDPPDARARATSGLDLGAWDRWLEYRRTGIRKPLKRASLVEAAEKLAAFGEQQLAVVKQSIANGWQGLFALDEPRSNGRKPVERHKAGVWPPPEDADAQR